MDWLKEIYSKLIERLKDEIEPPRADETFNLAIVGVLVAIGACLYGAVAAKFALLIAGVLLAPLLALMALAAKQAKEEYAAKAAKKLKGQTERQEHGEGDGITLSPMAEDDDE